MTRKDFELIAATIRTAGLASDNRDMVAEHFADMLHRNNVRFDKERFLKACTNK